jgi:DNA-binding PadR family transcriptional regulator
MRDRFGCGPGWGRGFGIGFGFDFPRVRARRGDVKFLLLEILKEGPKHGYEMITELEARFHGYRPSAGSVYPTLQLLEDGGFVTSEQVDGKKVYTITEAGLKLLEERGESRFEEPPGMKRAFGVWRSLGKLSVAVSEGARGNDSEVVEKIEEILNKARKEVYAILAES